uniref:Ubiquitin like with PHD and ring finger domains 1 n=1 Tax=Molossus molossus TaxID=27622 RepID=A0A7J8IE37_MOLMO|nr:ubiquitin like with PHD and ring finger domains 1 [Molossus molossus]
MDPSQGSPWAPCGGSESRLVNQESIGLMWRASTAGAMTGHTPWSWLGGMRMMWTMGIRSHILVAVVEIFPATSGQQNSHVIRNSPTPTGHWLSTAVHPSTTAKGLRPRTGAQGSRSGWCATSRAASIANMPPLRATGTMASTRL